MKFSRYTFDHPSMISGAEGIRTPDPLLARQVLSQLSYNPRLGFFSLFSFVSFF